MPRALLVCLLLGLAARARAEGLSESTLTFLRYADSVELQRIHGDRLFARGTLEAGPERDRLVRLLATPSGGPVAACFEPRHAIEAHDDARTVRIEICFECNQLEAGDERGTAPRNAAAVDGIFTHVVELTAPADPALEPLRSAETVELMSVDPDEGHKVYWGALLDQNGRDGLLLALAIGLRAPPPARACPVRQTYAVRAGGHAVLFDRACDWIEIDGGARRPFDGQAVGDLRYLFPPPPRKLVTGALALGALDLDEVHTIGIPDGPQYPSLVFHLRGTDQELERDDFVLFVDNWEDSLFVHADAVTSDGGELLVRFPPPGIGSMRPAPFDGDEHELVVMLAGMPVAHRSLRLHERRGVGVPRDRPSRPWIPIVVAGILTLLAGIVWQRRRRA